MIRAPTVGFVSLGCPKALVDSEHILTCLRAEGYAVSATYEAADLVVVNTCGFIDSAVAESLDAVGEALDQAGRVIVTGCLGTRADQIRERHPRVLAITGPHDTRSVMDAVHEHLPVPQAPFTSLVPPQGIKLTPRHYAYLKISEGCNHHCSFCIIPSLRGKLVSRPADAILQEAENLVSAGIRELLVVSQDTSAYGVDLKYATRFWRGQPVSSRIADLAETLGRFGIWIRLHYVYPYPHVDSLISLMAEGCILPYLDVPLQHASPRILRAMQRPACGEDHLRRIESWRKACPDLTLRSTFIVGFPGETEADFEELLAFLDAAQLDRVGCFAYSPVQGAAANQLDGAVPEEIKLERQARLMEHQAAISHSRLQTKVGAVMQVLVDEVNDGQTVARSAADAPEIDGNVILEGDQLTAGEFAMARITAADTHDLFGRAIEN